MNQLDPISAADEAEERCSRDALRSATSKDDLVAAWWRDCERFSGAARERLQDEYAVQVRRFGLVGHAG